MVGQFCNDDLFSAKRQGGDRAVLTNTRSNDRFYDKLKQLIQNRGLTGKRQSHGGV
mgnify:FL=1|jgi:hypothetical protein